MDEAAIAHRRATRAEIDASRDRLRTLAQKCGLSDARLREDGAIVVHSERPGYLPVGRFADQAARILGSYVHVVTDDVVASELSISPL